VEYSPPVAASHAIRIRGARVHNLRNIDVDVPRDALVVFTGVSGSGKSSLAFDTLFAEGQRRYLESLSAWTRQFLDQLERPDVDLIDGLPPTISIDQRSGSVQPRSTLATTTEIHDFLRLLYARAGQAHCPTCGREVSGQSSQEIVRQMLALEDRRKVMILAPLIRGRKGRHHEIFEQIARDGFVRARVDGQIVDAADPPDLAAGRRHTIEAVIDRIVLKDGIRPRLQESVDLALRHGEGSCLISYEDDDGWHDRLYSDTFACPECGTSYPTPEPRMFSFNSPYGACPKCDGLGVVGDETCPACHGARLSPFARAATVGDTSLPTLLAMTIADATAFVRKISEHLDRSGSRPRLPSEAREVARRVLPEVAGRLEFLLRVGLGYLTLDRPTQTLSGGEFQRARLAGCLGSGLTGVCYILDEPTIGLHPRDTDRLVDTLCGLRDQGNTIVVVEHDLDTIRRADHVIDLGPGAGPDGGLVVAAGRPEQIERAADSLTGRFLREARARFSGAAEPDARDRQPSLFDPAVEAARAITASGVRTHNLQDVTVAFPHGRLTCVTGVSGSGKSSLVTHSLVPAVRQALARSVAMLEHPLPTVAGISGVGALGRLVEIDQSPLGRTGRSNPATYSGLWDEVRKLYARTREARLRGFTARRFSFNSREGRCEACRGQGTRRIEMHYLPDMHVTCPVCRGARFNPPTLSVRFRGRNVADVLAMRFDEALACFDQFARLRDRMEIFVDVGLGYLTLGQSSLALSGGESQRVRLATELSRPGGTDRTLFVLDEPTTGLHPADVERLLSILRRLVGRGDTVIVIEHQLDLIALADWMIDLGPEGGRDGGRVVASGRPVDVAAAGVGHTARAFCRSFAELSRS
jgi:excinuclease ABC subunit A